MSAFSDLTEAIKTRLEGDAGLSSVDVLIDDQKDIKSDFRKAIGRIKGGVVVIFFDGYSTPEPDVDSSRVESDFILLVWTKPVIRKNETRADDIVSDIHKSLHGWNYQDRCRDRAVVTRGRVVPNPQFLVHEMRVSIKHNL